LSHQGGNPRSRATFLASLKDDAVRYKQRIDIPRHASGVISECHRRAADHEHIRDNAPPDQPIAQRGERPFKLCPV